MLATDEAPTQHAGVRVLRGSAWGTLAVLTLIYTCHMIDRTVMSIVIEPIKKAFSLSDGQVGLLNGLAYAVIFSLASAPIGYLVDRTNRRNLLAGLLTVWRGCTALCGFSGGLWSLAAARLAVGATEAGGAPASMSMISDLFSERQRSLAIGIFWSSTALGAAISFIVGSIVASHYGWRAAFFMAGAPGLIMSAVLLIVVGEPSRKIAANDATAPPSPREIWRYAVRQPLFVHSFIAVILTSIMLSGEMVWLPSFLIRVYHVSLSKAGLIAGLIAGLCGGFGSLAGGWLGYWVYRKGGLGRLPIAPC